MKYWTTKNGDDIAFNKLEDSHLLNILNWVEKKSEEGELEGSCGFQGDDDFMTGDVYEIFGEDVLNKYDYDGLLKEARKRKLLI